MINWRGRVREGWGTCRTAAALLHPYLVWLRLRHPARFRAYARPLFERYVQSLAPHVAMVDFTEMLDRFGIGRAAIECAIPTLEGYVGLSDWERVALATLARHWADLPVLEIGTAAGSTTLLLARNTRNRVYTLDLPRDDANNQFALPRLRSDDEVIAGRARGSMLRKSSPSRICELKGDSATFDFAPYHDRIGLFFIDGAHSYEYVRSDTVRAARCCDRRGIVVWHDFGSSREVTRWLNRLASRGPEILGLTGTTLAFSRDLAGMTRALQEESNSAKAKVARRNTAA